MHSKFLSDSNTFYRRYCPVLILLLGALLRLLYLSRVPGGLHQDEAFVLLNSYDLLHEGRDSAGYAFPIYMSSWGDGQSAMYSWLLTPLLLLNKGIPTTFLGRLPQALVGILTLWCVYCLVKEMFGHTAGLWALFALSVCPWHIMACRWALDANMAPGFLMFGLYFFVRGMNDNRYLLLSALFYGLSLYCYAVIWPMLPILLALQVCYGIRYHKIHCSVCSAPVCPGITVAFICPGQSGTVAGDRLTLDHYSQNTGVSRRRDCFFPKFCLCEFQKHSAFIVIAGYRKSL